MSNENTNPQDEQNATAEQSSAPALQDQGTQDGVVSQSDAAPAQETAKDEGKGTEVIATEESAQAPAEVQAAVEKKEEPISDIQTLLNKLKTEGTPTEQALIKALDAYTTTMAPGKAVDAKVGVLQQHTLWQNLRFAIQSSPDGEFNRLWNLVLAYAHEHKDGAFHERYITRFSEDWHYDLDDLSAFQRLINLIKLTADSSKREKALRQVDINRTLEKGFTDRGRTRLISFYS